MERIMLHQSVAGWSISGHGIKATCSDLDAAACSALDFAELFGAGDPELGPNVPDNALDRGRSLRERLAVRTKRFCSHEPNRYQQD
jgi:hypothetical protein